MSISDPFAIIAMRQPAKCFDLGATITIHRHCDRPLHFHLLLDLAWWFVEMRIGRDHFKEGEPPIESREA